MSIWVAASMLLASSAWAQPMVAPHPGQPIAAGSASTSPADFPGVTMAPDPVCNPSDPLMQRSLSCFSGQPIYSTAVPVRRRPDQALATSVAPVPSTTVAGAGSSLSNYTGSTSPGYAGSNYSPSTYSGSESSYRSRSSYRAPSYRPRTVQVRSYTRRDGTRVRAHTRSRPRR